MVVILVWARLTPDQCQDSERHDEDGDHKIGYGEWHKEVVGDVLKTTLPTNGQTYEDVAGGGSDGENQRR